MTFNIRQKLLLGFALVLAALLAVGGFAYLQLGQLQRTLQLNTSKEIHLSRAQALLWSLRYSSAQAHVATDTEERKKLLTHHAQQVSQLEAQLQAYGDSQELTPDETSGHEAMRQAWRRYKAQLQPWLTELAEGKTDAAMQRHSQQLTPLSEAATQALDRLQDSASRADTERRAAPAQAAEEAKNLMLALGGAAMVLGLVVMLLLARGLTRPIDRLQQALQKLHAGDYSVRTRLTGGDELSQLGEQLDRLLDERLEQLNRQALENDKLNDSVVEIMQAMSLVAGTKDLSIKVPVTEDVTGTISDAMNMLTAETARVLGKVVDVSNEVSAASTQVQHNAESAMAAASRSQEEVETAATELLHTAQVMTQLAQTAQRAQDSAEQSVRTTRQALSTVDKTVSGINESRDLIRETEKRIKRLGERSQEITQVVGLINSIAERTGILALNASMQATSAGEAGRGFAIVADEVKRLSENAREATREIAMLVSSIQSETSETVLAMNNAISRVVDVSRLADQAGAEMQGTRQASDDLAAHVRSMATTSVEQARLGQTLQARAQSIQQSSRDTSSQLAQQTEAIAKLVGYAQALLREVRIFKLPRSTDGVL